MFVGRANRPDGPGGVDLCTADHALFFDCRSYDAEQVALDLAGAGLELLVLDTKTPHALVDSEYAARRASCEEAARLLGVAALRDVTISMRRWLAWTTTVMRRRVRHVVTENIGCCRRRRRCGPAGSRASLRCWIASHASMRDDFEITVPHGGPRGRERSGRTAPSAPG